MSIAALIKRKLPGLAWRKTSSNRTSSTGEDIQFIKGRIIHSGWGLTGPVTQTIETDSKIWPYLKLIGDTYCYWCNGCGKTIWEQELILAAANTLRSAKPGEQKCPMCSGFISPLQPGDRVRVHYRFSPEGNWASWWAEKWD